MEVTPLGEFAQPPFTSCLKVPLCCAKSWPLRSAGTRARAQKRNSLPRTVSSMLQCKT
jgi:hypothetical protein